MHISILIVKTFTYYHIIESLKMQNAENGNADQLYSSKDMVLKTIILITYLPNSLPTQDILRNTKICNFFQHRL